MSSKALVLARPSIPILRSGIVAPSSHLRPGLTKRASSFPYEGATTGRRLGQFTTTRDAINSVWYQSQDQLVSRSRDQVRKDGFAAKAVEEWVCNAIGTGIKPQSQHPDPAVKAEIQKLWTTWNDEADAAGQTSLYGLQSLIFRSMVEGGECFVRLRPRLERDGLTVPLQLQVMESEQLPWYLVRPTPDTPEGRTVRMSIEFDQLGRRTAYYFYKDHPGERLFFTNWLELNRVPAQYVMHVYRALRPGQVRGIPWLAPALSKLWELDQYDDAELLRKKFASMFTAFITRTDQNDSFFPNATSSQTTSGGATLDTEAGIQVANVEPGTVQELDIGESIVFNNPPDTGSNYQQFERVQLLRIGAALGLPYDMLTGDLSETSYSSIRAGILGFRRLCEQIQWSVFVFQFCRPTWRAFIDAAVSAGRLDVRQFTKSPDSYYAVEWHTPKWAWVDPLKDVEAEVKAIRAGLKARSDTINEMGDDEARVDEQQARDNERADRLGLVHDSDPRRTNLRGQIETPGSAIDPVAPDKTGKTE